VPIPVLPVVCHIYVVTVKTAVDTAFTYFNCSGNEVSQPVIGSKQSVEYTICGIAGQVLVPSTVMNIFFYEETATNCTT
jgi:hypothetical protein